MNCRFCGTALPEGALFCGECGRPVGVANPSPATPVRSRPAMPSIAVATGSAPEPVPSAVHVVDSEFSCPQCGEPIGEDDVFCGACGFVLSSSYLSAPVDAVGDPRVGDEPEDDELDDDVANTGDLAAVSGWVPVEPEPVVEDEPEPVAEADVAPETVAEVEPDPVASAPEPSPVTASPQPRILRSAPDPFPWGKDPRVPAVDLEATRISAAPIAEERFVLQFSTGESVTVSGAGLVGRNPASQPGEFVDQLVTIFDAGKSVSKTHLEFGQDGGRFWVSDRFSTNGSTVRQPELEPKRCEPGRRYFVARGTRVDIGDQFFIVS